jgi:streptogramin lyase
MKKILLFALFSTFCINAQTPSDYVTGLNTPTGIAFDSAGNLYVADYGAYNVTKITPNFTKTPFISALNGTPQQIAFDVNGNLWIAGSGSFNGIVKVNTAGVSTTYSASGSPYGIAVDASGNAYYSEANSGDIKKLDPNGTVSTFATGLTQPNGMVFDKLGNLIVADKGQGEIKKITPAGVVSTLISGMMNPSNLLYTPNGDLYISTGILGRIFRFPAGSANGTTPDFYIRPNISDSVGQMAFYNGALYVSTNAKKVIKITDPMLGLKDVNNVTDNFVVYPNPATDYLVIENSKVDLKTIQLFDMTGREVQNFKASDSKDNKIILSNLTSGNYILKVNNTSKKIIVK